VLVSGLRALAGAALGRGSHWRARGASGGCGERGARLEMRAEC
jgi:hypothetical protein